MTTRINSYHMLEYDIFSPYSNMCCFSTTRQGGESIGNYASMNCNAYCGDNTNHVAANRQIVLNYLSSCKELVFPHQTHGSVVRVVDDAFLKFSVEERIKLLEGVDSLVTAKSGYCLCISTADCIPVMMYDTVNNAVAAIHAGWRGTVRRIVEHTVQTLVQEFDSNPSDLVACIGPGIGLEAFEVGDEVYQAFQDASFPMEQIARRKEKWHIDLWEANRLQLINKGIPASSIQVAGICTYTQHQQFFSARRLGINSGRILSGIMIR